MDARSTLYKHYVSTHFAGIRTISREAVQGQQGAFRHYFGRLLPRDRKSKVLEVGCGYGSFVSFLHAEGYRNAEGIDISPEQVEAAQALGISGVTCADAVSFLRERPGAFDCIVAIDFLDHFPKNEVLSVLEGVHGGLRPDGVLIFQAVNADGPFFGRLRYADFTHEFALTAISARQILQATGFTGVQILGTDPYVHGPASLARVAVWQVAKLMWRTLAIAETGAIKGHILTQNLIAVARKPAVGV